MKYVSVCCRSAGGDACMIPEMPPMVNSPTSAMANNICVVKRSWPPHIVKIQLKIFTPVGIAMSIVVRPKNVSAIGPMPTANMWCAHTPKPSTAMRIPEYTITGYPNSGFLEYVGSTSDTSPNAGRTRM